MSRKQADRRPDEKPAEQQGQGKYDPGKPESGRRMPEVPEGSKRFGQQFEGHPIDKPSPKPGTRVGRKDDGDRSDRESGRPIQLEDDDDEGQNFSSGQHGQADVERGLSGRPQEGREDRKPYEAEKTRR